MMCIFNIERVCAQKGRYYVKEYTILVVDDDKEIVRAMEKILQLEAYQVEKAYNGIEALDIVMSKEIDLIVLDVMMPKLDGLSTLMKIREKKNLPVIILSAKTEESDMVSGLSMGADDYISKPFHTGEFLARIKAQLRRYYDFGAKEKEGEEGIEIGGLYLNPGSKEILVNGEAKSLTATEYKILELLMKNPGRVFSAEEIYERVWNEGSFGGENTVMVHIRRIRSKIEINPKKPEYLKVVWGIGYKIELGKKKI